jgi:hypothetical protein
MDFICFRNKKGRKPWSRNAGLAPFCRGKKKLLKKMFSIFFFIFFPNFFLELCKRCSKMEEQEDGWLTVLEKNGLGPAAAILENYGIDSETDLLVLDQDDFSKLASRGLKPLYAKKLELWCGSVRERGENMLPSSLKTPAASALLNSDTLNVVTPTAHSVGAQESECESGSENESERDGENDDD